MEMRENWQKLIAALVTYSPELVTRLNVGTDEAAIARAEQRLGVLFTEEVKAFFHLQDGSNGPLFGSWAFLSLEEICDDWLAMKEEMSFSVQPDEEAYYAWKENWLPLLRASSSMRIYVRIDAQGDQLEEDALSQQDRDFFFRYGKLPYERVGTLFLSNARADFVAASINEFLERLITSLVEKDYVYDKDIQGLRTRSSGLSPLPSINEPSFYALDDEFPDVTMPFGDRVAYPGLWCISYTRDYLNQPCPATQRTIVQSWEAIRSSIEQIAPEIMNDFGAGVSINDLQRAEREMHMHLPEQFKTWYSLCNGTLVSDEEIYGAFDFWHWFTLEHLSQQWKLLQEEHGDPSRSTLITGHYFMSTDARIQPVWWHSQWLPFMYHEDGSVFCIDGAPTSQGQTGQIILLMYKSMFYGNPLDIRRIPPIVWVAPDLGQFLAVFAQDLLQGKYTFDTRSKMLWSVEGLAYVEEEESLHFLLERRRDTLHGKDEQQENVNKWQAFLRADMPTFGDGEVTDNFRNN